MKTKQLFAIFIISIISLSLKAQDYSVKRQLNANIYANTQVPYTWMIYYVDVSYGIAKQLDLGLDFGTSSVGDYNTYLLAIVSRYYFTPLIIKNPQKIDLYLKAKFQYGMVFSKTTNYSDSGYGYGLYLGIRYMPLKRIGIMTEIGCVKGWNIEANVGLSFNLNK